MSACHLDQGWNHFPSPFLTLPINLCVVKHLRRMSCPDVLLKAAPGVVSFCAVAFTYVSAFSCSLATYGDEGASSGLGLWTVEDTSGPNICVLYESAIDNPQNLFDSVFKFARATSMIAVALSVPTLILILLLSCVSLLSSAYFYVLAGISVGQSTFLLLSLVRA